MDIAETYTLIHVNTAWETATQSWPVEIGLSKVSAERGPSDYFHSLHWPADVGPNVLKESRFKADQTHKLFLDAEPLSSVHQTFSPYLQPYYQNYLQTAIEDFVGQEHVYAHRDDVVSVRKSLRALGCSGLTVLSLHKLTEGMLKTTLEEELLEYEVGENLRLYPSIWTEQRACVYHQFTVNRPCYCSLAKARHLARNFFRFVSSCLGTNIKPLLYPPQAVQIISNREV